MQQRTILLVEPDSALRAIWRVGLQSMGFALIEAGDAVAARREPRLSRLKILVITDHAAEADRAWALKNGANAYLLKPVRVGRMLQVSARLATMRGPSRAEARAVR